MSHGTPVHGEDGGGLWAPAAGAAVFHFPGLDVGPYLLLNAFLCGVWKFVTTLTFNLSLRLDPILFRKCQGDASRLCYAHGWNETSENMPAGAIFSCLYRHAYRTEEQGRRVSAAEKACIGVIRYSIDSWINGMPLVLFKCSCCRRMYSSRILILGFHGFGTPSICDSASICIADILGTPEIGFWLSKLRLCHFSLVLNLQTLYGIWQQKYFRPTSSKNDSSVFYW